MDTVTYPDARVADFIQHHFAPARVRVKENPRLVEDYAVAWTPNVVIADADGRIHDRIEGYLPPEDFLARLSIGVGKSLLNRKQFARAAERFEEVAQRHAGTDTAAEGLYWLGVARYTESHDPAQLHASWQRLAREYPESIWATRTRIPGQG